MGIREKMSVGDLGLVAVLEGHHSPPCSQGRWADTREENLEAITQGTVAVSGIQTRAWV